MPSLRVAYVDTETTGLSAYSDRIIEIAIVLAEVDWETGQITQRLDQYQGLQDPGRRIPADAMAVHGITDAMVRGHRIDGRTCTGLLAVADICLAHNSGFRQGLRGSGGPRDPQLHLGVHLSWDPVEEALPIHPINSPTKPKQAFRVREGGRPPGPRRCGDHHELGIPPRHQGGPSLPALHLAQEDQAEGPGARDRGPARSDL